MRQRQAVSRRSGSTHAPGSRCSCNLNLALRWSHSRPPGCSSAVAAGGKHDPRIPHRDGSRLAKHSRNCSRGLALPSGRAGRARPEPGEEFRTGSFIADAELAAPYQPAVPGQFTPPLDEGRPCAALLTLGTALLDTVTRTPPNGPHGAV